MALNASLVLSGNAEGAEAALRGVDAELGKAEKGAKDLAAAYAKVDASIDRVAQAQATAKNQTAASTAAYRAGELTQEQYNRELLETKTALGIVEAEHRQTVAALRQTNQALGQSAGQTGMARAGYTQLGQQMQDVAVMAMMPGVNIGTIIATQGGQVATAVQMMGGRFSNLAAFIAGPWGAAVLVGASILGNMVSQLWEAEEAAAAAEAGADGLSAAQSVLGDMFDMVSGKIERQNELLIMNARLTAMNLRAEALAQRESSRDALGNFDRGGMGISTSNKLIGMLGIPVTGATRRDLEVRDLVRGVEAGKVSREDALRQSANLDFSGLAITRQEFQQALIDQVSAEMKDKTADLIDESLDTGNLASDLRREGPKRGPKRERKDNSAEREARALQRLVEWGDRAEESIARISERFGEQPKLIVQVNQATRQLDETIADLERRKPPGFEDMIGEANIAKAVVQEALVRPFTELRQESERRQQVDLLLLAGKEDQAAVVQQIWQMEQQLGPLTKEQRAEVEAIVLAEQEHLELLEKAQETQLAYLDTTRGVRGELEAMLAGRGDLSNFKQMFRDLKARIMVEQIFGPALQELEDYVTDNTALPDAVDTMASETNRAGLAAGSFADALISEAQRIANPGAGSTGSAFDAAFANYGQEMGTGTAAPLITVTAERPEATLGLTPERFFQQLSGTVVMPLLDGLNDIFGVEFFSELQGAVSTAFYGYATAGTTGGVLGFAKGLVDDFGANLFGGSGAETISRYLGSAMEGAQTGSQIAGFGKMLGIGMSSTGSQIGGALGSVIPGVGPIGGIIGSVAGGLLGGLFSSKPYGTASLSGPGGASISGKGEGSREGASSLGGSVQEGLSRIAERLGAEIGAFKVSIGTYNDSFRVSTTGYSGGKLNFKGSSANGLRSFTNEADAIAFAIADAIGDGAITGVSEAVQRALRSKPDVEKAIEEAMKVGDLEELLTDAGDAWLEELRRFEEVASERVDLARRYGLDLIKVEELNAKERLQLTEDLLEEQVGSLQDLIEQMTSGNLFEGSAVDRRELLLGDIATARAAAQAGEEGAADRLVGLLRQLNEVSAEVYGSTGGFASDRDTILDTARTVIAAANQRIEEAKTASDPALVETNAALDENNDQNAVMIARLDELTGAVRDLFGSSGSTWSQANLMNMARTN